MQLLKTSLQVLSLSSLSGDSANAVPHYHKLYARVPHVWGKRRGQPNRSAMERPRPWGASLLIKATPAPGKYALFRACGKPQIHLKTDKLWCQECKRFISCQLDREKQLNRQGKAVGVLMMRTRGSVKPRLLPLPISALIKTKVPCYLR